MQAAIHDFEEFYSTVHQHKKLNWIHSLGTVSLIGRFEAGEKELLVSLFQSLVLLLFNDEEEINYESIKSQLELEDEELKRVLQSLSMGKKRILTKIPIGKKIENDHVFKFRKQFTDLNYRVRINTIQVQESAKEEAQTNGEVDLDREYQTKAAIVRIMKAHKTLSHQDLLNKTIEAVQKSFMLKPPDFKAKLDKLMEEEYIRRGEGLSGKNIYHYIA